MIKKFVKIFSTALMMTALAPLKAYCGDLTNADNWTKALVQAQKSFQEVTNLPNFEYQTWKENAIGGILEKKKVFANDDFLVIVVPGAFTPTCTKKHIQAFVNAYKNEGHILNVKKVPTFVVSRDNPHVMANWANHMGANNELLQFVADPSYKFMSELGILEENPRLGLIGHRSIFYFKNSTLVNSSKEENNADVCKTSLEEVSKFFS